MRNLRTTRALAPRVIVVGLVLAGASQLRDSLALVTGDAHSPNSPLICTWSAPSGVTIEKDELDGAYAACWPTMAALCWNAADVMGAEKRAIAPDATLFLVSHPALTEASVVSLLPTSARLAIECRSDVRAAWFSFGPLTTEPFLVITEPSGGNCGDTVRVIQHLVTYEEPHAGPDAFQNHTFHEEFRRECVTDVCVGDVNGDSVNEFVVLELSSARPQSESVESQYLAYGYDGSSFKVVAELDSDAVRQIGSLKRIE